MYTPNFSLHNTYKVWHLVMRKWDLIKQIKLLKIKTKILVILFVEKYGFKLGELNSTTGTERVKVWAGWICYRCAARLNQSYWAGWKKSYLCSLSLLMQWSLRFPFIKTSGKKFWALNIGWNFFDLHVFLGNVLKVYSLV